MGVSPKYATFVQPVAIVADPNQPDAFLGSSFDEVTSAQVSIRTPHHEVHEGEMFRAFVWNLALADDAKLGIVLRGSTEYGHVTYLAACGGDFEFILRRNPTITAPGGALAEINVHDASGKVATVVATSNPTVTNATGAELDHFVGPGGTGGNATGGSAGRDEEKLIMRLNANYYLELFNRSGGAKVASLTALWYEEGTKGG